LSKANKSCKETRTKENLESSEIETTPLFPKNKRKKRIGGQLSKKRKKSDGLDSDSDEWQSVGSLSSEVEMEVPETPIFLSSEIGMTITKYRKAAIT
jgi:hypothetical protein